ncbi:hypothetical protein PGT21_000335 [Puccinia graminis f. sp. tritici]|uniref:Uncharacterized protein n=1 Tax=Puccinia graminis f. sp. tritici TaxID=56615 RepID=A0A5B0MJB2_PUCGR|nr:hypothetical protein PGT21_000335 [Puccinia graminis f. sp. tritici]
MIDSHMAHELRATGPRFPWPQNPRIHGPGPPGPPSPGNCTGIVFRPKIGPLNQSTQNDHGGATDHPNLHAVHPPTQAQKKPPRRSPSPIDPSHRSGRKGTNKKGSSTGAL